MLDALACVFVRARACVWVYVCHSYTDAAGEVHELQSTDEHARRMEIDHLPHGFELRFVQVCAVNGAGIGPARDVGDATTHNVPGCPEDVFITDTTTTTVGVEWDVPDVSGGVPITGFHVRYTSEGDTYVTRVENDVYAFQIAGMRPGQVVEDIRVLAENEVGVGPPSESLTATTKLPKPPAPEAPELRKAYVVWWWSRICFVA